MLLKVKSIHLFNNLVFSSEFFFTGVIHFDETKYFLWFEVAAYDGKTELFEEHEQPYRHSIVKNHFRKWSLVQKKDLQNITVFNAEENGRSFYKSNTRFYLPWWLKLDANDLLTDTIDDLTSYETDNERETATDSPVQNSASTNSNSTNQENDSESETSINSPVHDSANTMDNSTIPETDYESEASIGSSDELRSSIVHSETPINPSTYWDNVVCHTQVTSNTSAVSEDLFEETTSSPVMSREQFVDHLKQLKLFVDSVLIQEEYLKEKALQEQNLNILLNEAVEKSIAEKINLQEKGNIQGRYVNLFKRLSLNSVNICEESIKAREKYNKAAQSYNDSLKKLKTIEITDKIKTSLCALTSMNNDFVMSYREKKPVYGTLKEIESSEIFIKKLNEEND